MVLPMDFGYLELVFHLESLQSFYVGGK